MKKYLGNNFFTILISIAMLSLPLLEFIGNIYNKQFFYQEQTLSFIGFLYTLILLIFFLYNIFHKSKATKKFVLSDLLIVLSIIFCIISIFFSKNIKKSLKGEYGYSETPLQVLGYFSLFFMCTLIYKENNKKLIFKTFIFLAIFESIIAFLQNFNLWITPSVYDSYWHELRHMAFGLTEHCNFFAAISIIFTGICAGKFIYENGKTKSYIYLILSTITCLSTLFTYTRISWVGIFSILFAIFFIESILYKTKNDKGLYKTHKKKFFVVLIIFLTCFLVVGISSGQLLEDIFNSAKELTTDFENFGTKRGTIWKVGLYSLRYYPLTGTGFDNYRYSFQIYPENFGWSQNKGHNEYIHTLVTQGIFSGTNYLAFAFYCFFFPFLKILKGDSDFGKSDLTKIFLIALSAYFIQALFNSSVTNVAPYKWILMGLLLPRIEQTDLLKIKLSNKIRRKNEKNI